MKNSIIKSLCAIALLFTAASCEDYNEQFEGYEAKVEITDIQTLAITLTADDYSTIASNSTNKALAEELGLSSELAAISDNLALTNDISAELFLPAYLTSLYEIYLSTGSSVTVTHNFQAEVTIPEYAISEYTVTTEDYVAAYGSEEDALAYFTPSVSASRKLPALLLAGLPDAVAGDYAVAIYSECDSDPSSEDGDTSISLVIEGANGLPEEKTSNTITVSDISFYFDAMYYSLYGSYTLLKSDDGYLSNTTEMTGLSEIIATDDYSYYNLSLYVGASADEVTTLVEYVQSGDDRVYTIPAGNSYFKIVNESSYAAQADSFKFTYDGGSIEFAGNAEGFPTAYPTGSITVEDVTFAYDNCYYSSYGSYTIDKYTDGFFGNTTELIDLKTVTLTDDYTHFNFSLYVGTVAGELAEEVVYEQDGDDRIFTIPSGYGFFTIVNEASYSAYCDKITITYGSVASSVMAKASATVYTGYSVYTFDGSAWSIPSDSDILAASDYVAMGTTYGNLSSSLDPDTLLPIYLANKYPYASDGDSLDVFYNYYDGTDTAFSVGFYTYLSGAWVNLNTTGISVVESAFNLVDSVWEMNKKTYLYLKDNTGMPDYDYITGEVTEFTVDGVTFEYQNTYYGEYYGSLSIPTGDGYWRNLTEMPGLSMIIVEEDYTYYNLSVYVGTAAGEETTLVEKVQDGNYYYYTIPEGYNFAKFCNETSYSAYCDSITFEFDGLE